ncbi:hypothetical protein Bpfe_005095, partial [Biomphalaria pfeifferi]
LCSSAVLSIEKELASALDYEDLINQFSQRNAREEDFCERQGNHEASRSSIASVLVHLCN